MKKQVKLALYILGIILLILALFAVVQKNNSKSYFTTYIKNENVKNNSISINQEQLNEGSLINITNKAIELKMGEENLFVIPVSSNPSGIMLNLDGKDLNLQAGREQKVDLNSDGIYDLLLKPELNESQVPQIYVKAIEDKVNGLNTKIEQINNAMKKQYLLVIILLILLLVLLVYRTLKEYIFPKMKIKRAKETEKISDVLKQVLRDIEETDNKSKKEELMRRARHLYKYLDREDQEKFKDKIE
jgi:hypothetical protein